MFLTTVLARDRVTRKGVPLAWLITNRESHHLLLQFLKWLRNSVQFKPHTILIDCSDTEALGITLAFEDAPANILYCYWHIWEAWDKNIKSKIVVKKRCKEDSAEIIQDIRKAAGSLLRAETVEEFDTFWAEIQTEWADQKAWIKYMRQEWIPHKERWAQAWRKHAHYGIDTNNYIESWHSNSK
ncbi:hypothetical protein K439DRAFT_1414646 [Ramaria rubella]|nr:hypothetical protein K439DRAFT_1414646 [Ramaria rubella]